MSRSQRLLHESTRPCLTDAPVIVVVALLVHVVNLRRRQPIPKIILVFDAHKVLKLHTSHSGCGVLSDKGFFVFGCNRFGAMGQGMSVEDLPAVRKPLEIEALKVGTEARLSPRVCSFDADRSTRTA